MLPLRQPGDALVVSPLSMHVMVKGATAAVSPPYRTRTVGPGSSPETTR
jgi:hypothetical protein